MDTHTHITTPEQFEALPIGTVVRDGAGHDTGHDTATVGVRTRHGWMWTDPIQNEIGPYGPVQVLYRPGITPAAEPVPTQAEVAVWLADTFGSHRSVEQQALVLAEEVGELCRAVVKRAQGIRGTHAEWTARLHAEAADVLITLLAIAATDGFDLADAAASKWARVTGRDATAERAPDTTAPHSMEGAA